MNLRLDFCSVKVARSACIRWHYSKSFPAAKTISIGAWEDSKFIGVIVFGMGANKNIGRPYGISQLDACELVRVALTKHQSMVSRIISISIKMITRHCPGIRLIVSYADPIQSHHGGIYQAGGWLYLGETKSTFEYRVGSRRIQRRSYTGPNFGQPKRQIPQNAIKVVIPGKHKYIKCIDKGLLNKLCGKAKPYPKRVQSIGIDALPNQGKEGGETPTCTLQNDNA